MRCGITNKLPLSYGFGFLPESGEMLLIAGPYGGLLLRRQLNWIA
jgi:hypothetical protein